MNKLVAQLRLTLPSGGEPLVFSGAFSQEQLARLALVGGRLDGYAACATARRLDAKRRKDLTITRSTLYVRLLREPPIEEKFRK